MNSAPKGFKNLPRTFVIQHSL